MRVLVVDDAENNRWVLELALEQLDITPDSASSGEEAIELIAKNEYDAVLLDLHLPGVTGIGVLKAINELNLSKKPRVVMLSSNDDPEVIRTCKKLGAAEYHVKPIQVLDVPSYIGLK